MNIKIIIYGIIALWLLAFAFASTKRPLWDDERNSVFISQGIASLVKDGAQNQCSAAPLYYILKSAWFSSFSKDVLTSNLLLLARLPSLLGLLFLLMFILSKYSTKPALLVLILITFFHQELIRMHAIEDRPYMLWTFFSFWFYYSLFEAFKNNGDVRKLTLLMIASILLIFTATGSLFQLFGGGLAIFFVSRKNLAKYLLVTAPAIVLGIYYATRTNCISYADTGDGSLSIISTLSQGNFSLLKALLKVVVAFKDPVEWPLIFLMGLGVWYYSKRENRSERDLFKLKISAIAIGSAVLLSGIAIAIKDYYFIPRMFIYLLFLKLTLLEVLLPPGIQALSEKFSWLKHRNKIGWGFLFIYGIIVVKETLTHYPLSLIFQNT